MMPHESVRDIMRRTMHNLEFVEARAGLDGPYEVTQLINSFLGALAHPWEAYRNDLTAMSLAVAHTAGWPVIAKERPSDREPDSLRPLRPADAKCAGAWECRIPAGCISRNLGAATVE